MRYNVPMESKYNHQRCEDEISRVWHSIFITGTAVNRRKKCGSYFIPLPPPNANDPLHVGHAMYTIEDILIRYHRMLLEDTLWLPGVDHAGIETQFVFEKKLQKKGLSRFQFDRETLYQMIWDYVQENADIAKNQLKKLGFSLDWSRFKYMLSPDMVATVKQTFAKLAEKNLVYRDLRLINYCPKCGTAFSDLEVKHLTKTTPLYYLNYGPLVVATTRPETKFGDIALAVHPQDKRYQRYHNQEITIQDVLGKNKLKVIADDFVDPEFGTGVVKITPYHDHHDYEFWQRHRRNLPTPVQVIDFAGKLTKAAGKYQGLKAAVARQEIVTDLQTKGLVAKIDPQYQTQISACYRCQSPLEPLPRAQFFIKTTPLAQKVLKKIAAGELTIYGAGHDKILHHWLTNLRDWNISRQIVWGIRLPIWYHAQSNPKIAVSFLTNHKHSGDGITIKALDNGKYVVSGTLGKLLPKYSLDEIKQGLQSLIAPAKAKYILKLDEQNSQELIQETDTFDTWFSSSQWPFSTLMNNHPGDFKRYYPAAVLETGYDILPFWVMRMLLIGNFVTGKLPFKRVYLHGLVRDKKGQKMSKSKGNVINPLDVVAKYGADALRFALVVRSTPGMDKSIGEGDFKAARNLTNKIWNAARFVKLLHQESATNNSPLPKDQEFQLKINHLITQISSLLDQYKIGTAADVLYDEFWHFYCDQAIEWAKNSQLSKKLVTLGLRVMLQLLHPFVPFVTEKIWQELGTIVGNEKLLATSAWPKSLTTTI